MANGAASFTRKVITKSGNTLIFPPVPAVSNLASGETDVDIHDSTSVAEFPLGTKLVRGDQVFRYTKNGAVALAAGVPLQAAAVAHGEQDDDIVVGAAAAIGDYTVELTSTANLDTSPNDEADNFKDGYLVVNDEAGEGHLYKIKSNEGFSGTANSTFTLYEPLKIALTTSSQVGLIKNPYNGVIATAAVLTGAPMGTAPAAVTASYYFWMHTGGAAPCIAHAAIARGGFVIVGTTAAKADPAVTDVKVLQIIGYALTPAAADTETFIVFLTLDR